MRLWIENLLEAIRTGFWAIPLFAMLLALGLAASVRALDTWWLPQLFMAGKLPQVLQAGDSDTVRTILMSAGTGTLGVLGIAFSVTVTTLVLASQQFGPHVLRNYMGKRFVQVVLGAFVGTTLYAFLALFLSAPLATGPDSAGPVSSVLLALLLLTVDLILLVLFIHHTASSLQVDSIIEDIHDDLIDRLDDMCPERPQLPHEAEAFNSVRTAYANADVVTTSVVPTSGYIQTIDREGIMATCRKAGLVVQLLHAPGDYVIAGETLAIIRRNDGHDPGTYDPDPGTLRPGWHASDAHRVSTTLFRHHLTIGPAQTPQQNADFSIRQLVQIALRALSPALNDPFTAVSCVDRLASMIHALLEHDRRGGWYHDDEKSLRYYEPIRAHADSVALAFDQIIDAAEGHPAVNTCLQLRLTSLIELDVDRLNASVLHARLERLGQRSDVADASRV